MSHIYKHVPGIGVPGADDKNSDAPETAVHPSGSLGNRALRPCGRVLGYGLTFTAIFVLIFLALWFLERGHF